MVRIQIGDKYTQLSIVFMIVTMVTQLIVLGVGPKISLKCCATHIKAWWGVIENFFHYHRGTKSSVCFRQMLSDQLPALKTAFPITEWEGAQQSRPLYTAAGTLCRAQKLDSTSFPSLLRRNWNWAVFVLVWFILTPPPSLWWRAFHCSVECGCSE